MVRAQYFGVIFDKVATYEKIKDGTQNASQIPGVNEIFKLAFVDKVSLVRRAGLEPARPFGPRHFKCRVSTYSTIRASATFLFLPRCVDCKL